MQLRIYLNNTSNEYTVQGIYTANGFVGGITELPQVFLAIYGTTVFPYSFTGSENIDTTDNRISLSFPLKVNGEVVLNPRNYDGAVFDMSSGNDIFYIKHIPWWSTNRAILVICKIMYVSW